MEDKIFKADAKSIVDMAFDNKIMRDDITRDNLNCFEELIQFLLQSRFESYVRIESLLGKLKDKPTQP